MKRRCQELFVSVLLTVFPVAADAAPPPRETGASLRGVVDLEATAKRHGLKAVPKSAEVELREERDGFFGNPGQSRAEEPRTFRTTTDASGAFTLRSLPQGFYTLKIVCGDLPPLVRRGVRVEADANVLLPGRLILEGNAKLVVSLTPPTDPWQRPWQVRLSAVDRPALLAKEIPASASGHASLEAPEEGEARLAILDRDGQKWHEQLVEIYPDRPELFLAIDVVEVRGRLLLGDEAVAATLSFGSTQGPDIRIAAGDDGRFQAWLPREGRWPLEVLWSAEHWDAQQLKPVEVRRRPGKTYAELEIRIPATQVTGRVLLGEEPAPGAGITVMRDAQTAGDGSIASADGAQDEKNERRSSRAAIVLTDREGRFALRGLEPGRLAVMARQQEHASEWVHVELAEGQKPEEVVLQLRKNARVHGLVSLGATPVAGARIVALPSDTAYRPAYAFAQSDAGGVFELELLAETTAIDLLVAAPTLGLELYRFQRQGEEWPNLLLALGTERGSLRLPLLLETRDAPSLNALAAGISVRRQGAAFRLAPVIEALIGQHDLNADGNGLLLMGLAPGQWALCFEQHPSACSAGEIQAGAELTLEKPAPPSKESP